MKRSCGKSRSGFEISVFILLVSGSFADIKCHINWHFCSSLKHLDGIQFFSAQTFGEKIYCLEFQKYYLVLSNNLLRKDPTGRPHYDLVSLV